MQHAVGRHLVAGAELTEIIENDLGDRDLAHFAVAHHTRLGRGEHGQPVERSFGPPLLHHTDQRVEEQDEPEEGILTLPEHEDQHEHRADDRVEPRHHVGAQDLGQRATGALVGRIYLSGSNSLGRFGRGQTGRARHGRNATGRAERYRDCS